MKNIQIKLACRWIALTTYLLSICAFKYFYPVTIEVLGKIFTVALNIDSNSRNLNMMFMSFMFLFISTTICSLSFLFFSQNELINNPKKIAMEKISYLKSIKKFSISLFFIILIIFGINHGSLDPVNKFIDFFILGLIIYVVFEGFINGVKNLLFSLNNKSE